MSKNGRALKERQQLKITPDTAQPVVVLLQQGMALYRAGQIPAAEAVFVRVMLADPGNPHALHLLGLIAHKRNDLEMAEQLIKRSAQLAPHSRVQHNLGVIQQQQGKLDEAISTYRMALVLEPDYLECATNLIFALDLHPWATPDLLLNERLAFDRAFCVRLTEAAAPHDNDRSLDRRLKVGYVSGDFRHHSAAMSFQQFLLAHDPAAAELYLYSTADVLDDDSRKFIERADVWADVAEMEDEQLADQIRADGIDILVDLSGFTKGQRLLVFARRPAPVQITGWGYSTGTGIAAMDYLMADAVTIPLEHEDRYREQILRLPSSLSYDPGEYPDLKPPPHLKNGYRTYGCLGRAVKVNARVLACWAELLRADPTAHLLLKGADYEDARIRARVATSLLSLGIEMSRVEVRGATQRMAHLEAHHDVDVMLDPFPHNSGVTAWDAALMGIPSVTLLGENVSGRNCAAVMASIGETHGVSRTVAEYIECARTMDPGTVEERAQRRARVLASASCDGAAMARQVEAAYRLAWRRWATT